MNRNGHEPCTSLNEVGIGNAWKNKNMKMIKKGSRPACDHKEDTDFTPYMVTGNTDSPLSDLRISHERIHSQPGLQQEEPDHDTTMDTTLPVAETVPVEHPQDPINRLADVLVNLQNKQQLMTIRPITTIFLTFDGKTEKFDLFEDVSYHDQHATCHYRTDENQSFSRSVQERCPTNLSK